MVFTSDKRTDKERGRKRKTRKKQKCAMWGCRQFAQYGWACGFCHSHAIMRGCPKQAKKLKAKHEEKSAWKLGNNPAEAEVTKPWWFDEDTELPDR